MKETSNFVSSVIFGFVGPGVDSSGKASRQLSGGRRSLTTENPLAFANMIRDSEIPRGAQACRKKERYHKHKKESPVLCGGRDSSLRNRVINYLSGMCGLELFDGGRNIARFEH